MQKTCSNNEKYDNIYVCKKWSNGDTIYVFEECEEVNKIAFDTISHFPAVIDSTNLTSQAPIKVKVFVPVDFKMPDNMKYLCVRKLSYQTEY